MGIQNSQEMYLELCMCIAMTLHMGLSQSLTNIHYIGTFSSFEISHVTLLQYVNARGSIQCAMTCSTLQTCAGYGFSKAGSSHNCVLLQTVILLSNLTMVDFSFKEKIYPHDDVLSTLHGGEIPNHEVTTSLLTNDQLQTETDQYIEPHDATYQYIDLQGTTDQNTASQGTTDQYLDSQDTTDQYIDTAGPKIETGDTTEQSNAIDTNTQQLSDTQAITVGFTEKHESTPQFIEHPGSLEETTTSSTGNIVIAPDGLIRLVMVTGHGWEEFNGIAGRVEVFYNGTWGTVCDNYFSAGDRKVICKHYGYSDGEILTPAGSFVFDNRQGTGQIWLDNLQCTGSESTLHECQHKEWGDHNCDHSEDVSVACY